MVGSLRGYELAVRDIKVEESLMASNWWSRRSCRGRPERHDVSVDNGVLTIAAERRKPSEKSTRASTASSGTAVYRQVRLPAARHQKWSRRPIWTCPGDPDAEASAKATSRRIQIHAVEAQRAVHAACLFPLSASDYAMRDISLGWTLVPPSNLLRPVRSAGATETVGLFTAEVDHDFG